jgi:uncharacterized protein (DUF1501 family)
MKKRNQIPNYSRRQFVKNSGTIVASSLVMNPLFGLFEKAFASGDNVTGYKALVCVLMNGGNDGYNWIVPLSNNSGGSSDYNSYLTSRGSMAIPSSSLLSLGSGVLASDNNNYGIHPSCPGLSGLFNSGKMAVLSNVGTLVQSVTPAQAKANASLIPLNLFSHNDQQHQWMSSLPNSMSQNVGWAGRVADLLSSQGSNPSVPLNISLFGNNLLQSGTKTNCYAMPTSGASALQLGGGSHGSLSAAFQSLVSQGSSDSNLMVQTYSTIHQQAAGYVPLFNGALSSAGNFNTTFPAPPADGPNPGLDQQFLAVAKLIKAQSSLKGTRQIFFIQANGFDTHANQLSSQAANLKAIDDLMTAFYNAMVEIGQQNNVVQFTMSDFGRSLGTNSGGTDHGWGSHHVVVGGSVVGGKFYGNMPSLVLAGANDFGDGRLIPSTSTDQLYATLLNWFGITSSDIASLLPNLANFTANQLYNFKSPTNIGFLG